MRGFEADVAETLADAKERMREARYDIAIIDVNLPDGSGLSIIEESSAEDPLFIVVTGGNDIHLAVTAIRSGAIDFITKPFTVDGFMSRFDVAVEQWASRQSLYGYARSLETLVRMKTEELSRSSREIGDVHDLTVAALGAALNLKDRETWDHCKRVSRNCVRLGRALALSPFELESLKWGAYLHDIGKIGVPEGILLKKGPLLAEERKIMERHPAMGHTMIRNIEFLRYAADVVLYHHESYDGSGYPCGLSGERIPISARIFSVFDTLDAVTSERPYRAAQPFARAVDEVVKNSGEMFDPEIVEAFTALPETTWLVQGGGDPIIHSQEDSVWNEQLL
jgi:cyclic di-GMP phosphodiesterase